MSDVVKQARASARRGKKAKQDAERAAVALAGGDARLGTEVLREAEAEVIRRFILARMGDEAYWLAVREEIG